MTSRPFKTDLLNVHETSPMPTIEKSETASKIGNDFSGATRDINAGETRFGIRPHRKDFASPLAAQICTRSSAIERALCMAKTSV